MVSEDEGIDADAEMDGSLSPGILFERMVSAFATVAGAEVLMQLVFDLYALLWCSDIANDFFDRYKGGGRGLHGILWEPFTSGIHAESPPKMIRFKLKLILASWSGVSRRGCVRKELQLMHFNVDFTKGNWHKGSFAIFRQTIINYLRASSFPPSFRGCGIHIHGIIFHVCGGS